MAYTKTNWVDDAAPAVSASNLNKMETGIYNAHVTADSALALASGLPKITTSAVSGGPPASPSNGDIWIATGVDANGTRWMFQYNAASASAFKWEFIGGPPGIAAQSGTLFTTALNTWALSDCVFNVPRAGEYALWVVGHASIDVAMNANVYVGARWIGNPSGAADFYVAPHIFRTAGDEKNIATFFGRAGMANPGTLTAMAQSNVKSAANYPAFINLRLHVTPIRIA